MPKLKTYKTLAKRVTITKSGKVKRRAAGQDHFNSHERGATTLKKRRDLTIAKSEVRNIKRLLPHA